MSCGKDSLDLCPSLWPTIEEKEASELEAIQEQFVNSDKVLASMLMKRLSGIKYNRAKGVHEHIMEMRNITVQLKALKISYNTHKDEWSINELLTMCVQERRDLSRISWETITESVNLSAKREETRVPLIIRSQLSCQ
uniref:Uncharacterized protein n=1 Tax=Ananas comosus var. bracteatus TaxID=296719 RepID=A0A6V7P1W4_ANACO|nr:unnamed protein product [Ananas comosus var. bracteatus]